MTSQTQLNSIYIDNGRHTVLLETANLYILLQKSVKTIRNKTGGLFPAEKTCMLN